MYADALQLFLASSKLIEAEEFADIEIAFEDVLNHAQWIAREKFATLASARVQEIKSDLHDEAIQAQGGL